jgi:chemotaxis protein MotB
MAADISVAPVIIKKKKVIAGGGHHGGAWKVAYADFVTAMMAFFMLMWLLNATTEKQRKGIADYFNPNIPINRISGGGAGAFGGQSIFSENTLAKSATGSSGRTAPWIPVDESVARREGDERSSEKLIEELNATLIGAGGESELMENAFKHVISRISDEGVVVEIFDLPGRPLFDANNNALPVLDLLISRVSNVAATSKNKISVKAHSRTEPVVRLNADPWGKTMKSSLLVRAKMEFEGVEKRRFDRITGKADTELFTDDPLAMRNNRIEIVFLIDAD